MIDFSALFSGFQALLTGEMALMIMGGTIFGILTGAIPGFSSAMAMIVMLPYSYRLEPIVGVVLMGAIFMGSCFGGSISSILLNIPGTPQAIATTFDGFPMTRQGKANEALGIALGASTFGSILGTLVLLFIRSAIIGVIIGILTGAGGMFATIVSYNEAKKASKDAGSYGKGNPQGIVAAETANNASQGGSYAILMALGIPGGSSTAVLYGALLVHNFVPGPTFVNSNMSFCYSVTISLLLCTLAMLILGTLMCFSPRCSGFP